MNEQEMNEQEIANRVARSLVAKTWEIPSRHASKIADKLQHKVMVALTGMDFNDVFLKAVEEVTGEKIGIDDGEEFDEKGDDIWNAMVRAIGKSIKDSTK